MVQIESEASSNLTLLGFKCWHCAQYRLKLGIHFATIPDGKS